MRKSTIFLFMFIFVAAALQAQTSIRGKVNNAGDGSPIPGVKVSLINQNISTQTNEQGEFIITLIEPGTEEVNFSRSGYFSQIRLVNIIADKENALEPIALRADVNAEMRQEVVLQLSESQIDNDDGRSQNVTGSLSANDVFTSAASFSFSSMRFNIRGYENKYQNTYINGVHFNSLERGNFNYSSLGGMNDAMRNKDNVYATLPSQFSYGSLAGSTNINTRATAYATGTKASVAYTNRSYRLRGQVTHATGLMNNGWAFAASAVVRWADKGMVDGTFYNSAGYFLSAEKVINSKHRLSLVTFGAPTQRAQQSAVTQEVYDLAGSIYYNPYWGYQDGKVRNSRVVKSFDPTVILSHDFKIDDKQLIRTGVAYNYSMYSNSALGFYNAPDPRPDYYRNLPSFIGSKADSTQIVGLWRNNDTNVTQVNWAELYAANYRNNVALPGASAKYIVERRHNNLEQMALNSVYTNEISRQMKLTAGIELKKSKSMHYKTIDDLLGGEQWIDIDQFAERDRNSLLADASDDIIQNDVDNPNKVIKEGENKERFGYDYEKHVTHAAAFVNGDWTLDQFNFYAGAKLTYTQFYRFGNMRNGRAEAVGAGSLGKGQTWFFTDPSLKAGATYKVDGRNFVSVNVLAETKAPQVNNSFVSERIKDTRIKNLQSEKILSYDLNYNFSFTALRGRITGFRTHILGTAEMLGYYDDEYRTFVNHVLTNLDRLHQGVEVGLSYKINNSFTVKAVANVADYRYTNNAKAIKSFENGSNPDIEETVLTKDLKISTGPQLAANVGVNYFHPKMWFAELNLNYYDNNYLDFAPNRFTETNMAKYTSNEYKAAFGTQEKLKAGFMLDASIGKLIYLKDRRSLNFNLSASNILNNTSMVTGGFQQARLPLDNGAIDPTGLKRFPNKYYYAWGFNMFFNVGYRF